MNVWNNWMCFSGVNCFSKVGNVGVIIAGGIKMRCVLVC